MRGPLPASCTARRCALRRPSYPLRRAPYREGGCRRVPPPPARGPRATPIRPHPSATRPATRPRRAPASTHDGMTDELQKRASASRLSERECETVSERASDRAKFYNVSALFARQSSRSVPRAGSAPAAVPGAGSLMRASAWAALCLCLAAASAAQTAPCRPAKPQSLATQAEKEAWWGELRPAALCPPCVGALPLGCLALQVRTAYDCAAPFALGLLRRSPLLLRGRRGRHRSNCAGRLRARPPGPSSAHAPLLSSGRLVPGYC